MVLKTDSPKSGRAIEAGYHLSISDFCGAGIYANHLESPGTKAYTVDEARGLFSRFGEVRISTVLTHGDLLESEAGLRHRGWMLSLAKRLWPRKLLRWTLPGHGLFMLIETKK